MAQPINQLMELINYCMGHFLRQDCKFYTLQFTREVEHAWVNSFLARLLRSDKRAIVTNLTSSSASALGQP